MAKKNVTPLRQAGCIRDAVLEAIAQLGGVAKREKILEWVAWNYGHRGWKKESVASYIQRSQMAPTLARTSYAHYARAGTTVSAKKRAS